MGKRLSEDELIKRFVKGLKSSIEKWEGIKNIIKTTNSSVKHKRKIYTRCGLCKFVDFLPDKRCEGCKLLGMWGRWDCCALIIERNGEYFTKEPITTQLKTSDMMLKYLNKALVNNEKMLKRYRKDFC